MVMYIIKIKTTKTMKNIFNKTFISINIILAFICLFMALKDLYNGGNSFGHFITYYIVLILITKVSTLIR